MNPTTRNPILPLYRYGIPLHRADERTLRAIWGFNIEQPNDLRDKLIWNAARRTQKTK